MCCTSLSMDSSIFPIERDTLMEPQRDSGCDVTFNLKLMRSLCRSYNWSIQHFIHLQMDKEEAELLLARLQGLSFM